MKHLCKWFSKLVNFLSLSYLVISMREIREIVIFFSFQHCNLDQMTPDTFITRPDDIWEMYFS